jgi:hypothetical protein
VAVVEGGPATLVCGTGLTGNPTPTVSWTDNNDTEVTEGGRVTLSSGVEEVSLSLASSARGDSGTWTCRAQVYEREDVTVGQPVERTVDLVVVVSPAAAVDVSVEETGGTWILLRWFKPSNRGNPPLSRHVVTVQEVGGERQNVPFLTDTAEANVTGLLPGTEYTLSVVAVSEFEGVEAPSLASSTLTVTTVLSAPAPVCSQAPRVEDDQLVVGWTYTHTGGEPITSADVFFKPDTSPGPGQAFSSVPGADVSEVGAREREDSIPLPEAGLHYQFSVRAGNGQGEAQADCPSLRLDTGVPARPDPPSVDRGDPVVVRVATQ